MSVPKTEVLPLHHGELQRLYTLQHDNRGMHIARWEGNRGEWNGYDLLHGTKEDDR